MVDAIKVKQYKISIKNLGLEENNQIYAIVDRDFKSNEDKISFSIIKSSGYIS